MKSIRTVTLVCCSCGRLRIQLSVFPLHVIAGAVLRRTCATTVLTFTVLWQRKSSESQSAVDTQASWRLRHATSRKGSFASQRPALRRWGRRCELLSPGEITSNAAFRSSRCHQLSHDRVKQWYFLAWPRYNRLRQLVGNEDVVGNIAVASYVLAFIMYNISLYI